MPAWEWLRPGGAGLLEVLGRPRDLWQARSRESLTPPRFSGGGALAVRFPYREAGPSHIATVSGPVPTLPTSRPTALAGWDHCSPPQTCTFLPSQTQTSNTASLCRPRRAWTGGKTSSRSELGTHPPFPGSGPSSVRNLASLYPSLNPYPSVKL